VSERGRGTQRLSHTDRDVFLSENPQDSYNDEFAPPEGKPLSLADQEAHDGTDAALWGVRG